MAYLKAIGISPAKIILLGEHFVVSGNSAVSMAIDLPTTVTIRPLEGEIVRIASESLGMEASFDLEGRAIGGSSGSAEEALMPVYVTAAGMLRGHAADLPGLDITVTSEVPVGVGLGSSAATAVSTVTAIAKLSGRELTKKEIFDSAYSFEAMIHGSPSGIDHATVTYGGLIVYRHGGVAEKLKPTRLPLILIGNTGKRRSTGELVSKVTGLRRSNPNEYEGMASEAQRIVEKGITAIRIGDGKALGGLMNENQRLLERLGVSSPELDRLIAAALERGALGAKLTGAGGGGCMITVVHENKAAEVKQSIVDAGGKVVPSEPNVTGAEASLQD